MKLSSYFTKAEKLLWSCSVLLIVLAFIAFDRSNYLYLAASLVGVTSLIFCAKGNPIGPLLMIIFSILYGIISFGYTYYGETITYVGMSLPMAAVSLVTWFKNPYKGKRAEVTIKSVTKGEVCIIFALSAVVTVAFYFILKYFGTANVWPSTFSVTTSFIAAVFSFRRSPYFALAYAVNDIVLIVLWTIATFDDYSYISVLVCFVVFLVNDMYSFISWKKRQKIQSEAI